MKHHFFFIFALYEFIPRLSFTALIKSSSFATSGSYFTTASLFSNETLTSLTPFTDSSADCTVDAQEPHVMPLISRVTVASFAAADIGVKRRYISNPRAARIVRVFMVNHLRQNYTPSKLEWTTRLTRLHLPRQETSCQ